VDDFPEVSLPNVSFSAGGTVYANYEMRPLEER